jgi:ATP-dependent RNA helicase DDX24/MAK5
MKFIVVADGVVLRLSDSDDPDAPTHHRKKARPLNGKMLTSEKSAKVQSLKNELRSLLSQPLMARGVSARYPTSGSKVIVDDLLSSKGVYRAWPHSTPD